MSDSLGVNTDGIVLHSPLLYDFTLWLATAGKESSFRRQLLDLAGVTRGESVLDVGCGTGTLAVAAKERVGPAGGVFGVDASPEMLRRAAAKARRAAVNVSFENAAAEALPFPTATFDIVLSVAMLHHLPEETRKRCVVEIRRVLKPTGRLLAVDFAAFAQQKRTLFSHLHRPHGNATPNEVANMLAEVGFRTNQIGEVGFRGFWYILAGHC